MFTVILLWLVRCRYLEEEKDVASKGPKKIEISYKIHDEKHDKQRLYDDTNMLPDKSQLQKRIFFCL